MVAHFHRALIAALLLALAMPGAAAAHERREVGKYLVVVGFAEEPALLGTTNGASIRIATKEDNKPVEGAEKTLKVSVAAGGSQPKQFDLTPLRGAPGTYVAPFIPTRTGVYIFTFVGTVGDQPINETFESGPGRFDEVRTGQDMHFPETLPSVVEMQRQLRAAEERASQATTLAYGGIALGVIGSGLALLALLRRSRPGPA